MGEWRSSVGVDVLLKCKDAENPPHCPHGPTLLFEKYTTSDSQKRYFACSACRDRKQCPFFRWADLVNSQYVDRTREMYEDSLKMPLSHASDWKRFSKTMKLPEGERSFCRTCNQFLLKSEPADHSSHTVTSPVNDNLMKTPTALLKTIENKKSNAQYLFSNECVRFLLDAITRLGYKKLLCIGTPSIHEAASKSGLRSLLLDIDARYQQFYPPSEFCHYNVFNHHFFNGSSSQADYKNFLVEGDGEDKVVLILDPPFGGRVEVLAHSMSKASEDWRNVNGYDLSKTMPLLWYFPYFMESRILENLPALSMLDYQVSYANHQIYKEGKRKRGSPVRIFTNIAPEKISLPEEEGYWFCSICKRYSGSWNQHCQSCHLCSSKDACTYVHCERCERCVKPSRRHCTKCEQCHLPDEACSESKPRGCHVCGQDGHKRKDCPAKTNLNRKRKAEMRREKTKKTKAK